MANTSGPFPPSGQPYPSAVPMQASVLTQQELLEKVRGKVVPPGIAMIVIGVLGAVVCPGVLFFLGAAAVFTPRPEFEVGGLFGAAGVLVLLIHIGVIYGGWAVVRLKSRSWGLRAAILCLLSFCFGTGIFGLIVGIWALVVLTSPDVKAAFERLQTAPPSA